MKSGQTIWVGVDPGGKNKFGVALLGADGSPCKRLSIAVAVNVADSDRVRLDEDAKLAFVLLGGIGVSGVWL